jgi:hypothetical protein
MLDRAKRIEVDLGDEVREVDGQWAVARLDEAHGMVEVLHDALHGIKPGEVTEAQLQTTRIMVKQIERRVFGGLQYLSAALGKQP